jgi:hypothetical protein
MVLDLDLRGHDSELLVLACLHAISTMFYTCFLSASDGDGWARRSTRPRFLLQTSRIEKNKDEAKLIKESYPAVVARMVARGGGHGLALVRGREKG